MTRVLDDGWYISGEHARRAIGYLTTSVKELNKVDVPNLALKWGEALEKTLDDNEASPVNSYVIKKGLQNYEILGMK